MQADHSSAEAVLWQPSPTQIANSRLHDYQDYLAREAGLHFEDYRALWSWSVNNLGAFWETIRHFFDVDISTPRRVLDESLPMPRTAWFEGSTTNYAANALRHGTSEPAIVEVSEDGSTCALSWDDLRLKVGALAHWLRDNGVGPGDRVAGYVPNVAAAAVGLLASAAVGAVWASCSQEYSSQGARDRFAQLEPKILLAADGYRYGGRTHDRRDQARTLASELPSVEHVLWIDHLGLLDKSIDLGPRFADVVSEGCEPTYTRVPFDHPLWVLFSSGTTGKPKGIVHSHGGIVLEHIKFLALHTDLRQGDVFMWLANPSWMVWNVQVSGLLCGATIALYDGSPAFPDASRIWQLAADLGLDYLGASAASLTAAHQHGGAPRDVAPTLRLRGIGSTGSPLPPSTASWVQETLPEVWLASACGGTDVCSAFAGGVPTEPVLADQIQGPLLGVAMDSWSQDGESLVGVTGEMVVTRPMPSMPLRFWDDASFERYHAAYFGTFSGVWRHGDWVTISEHGGVTVHGRSDATMNRQGVRIGSAEIYEVVEQLPAVKDSLIVGVEQPDGSYWMPLFVVLEHPVDDVEALAREIKASLRTRVSPRHVPDEVRVVDALPRTRTGKKLEVPVKRLLQGASLETVANPAAISDPSALEQFVGLTAR